MISSVFSTSLKKEVSFKINLLGLLNVSSLSDLIRGGTVIQDPVTGDLTIADTVTGTQIEAIVEPPKRQEGVRKAMFESLLVTAAYKASGAVEAFNLTSQSFHFAVNRNTNVGVMTDYLNWLLALNLLAPNDKHQLLAGSQRQGFSTCLLRTSLTDAQCRSMFFDEQSNLRPDFRPIPLRSARRKSELSGHPLAINRGHLRHYVVGIGHGRRRQAVAIHHYVPGGRDPASLRNDPAFAIERGNLQKKMAKVIGSSRARFEEPWGMVSLFWAAGSQGASARLVTPGTHAECSDG